MIKKQFSILFAALLVFTFLGLMPDATAEKEVTQVKVNVTILSASNTGNDFNLVNDAYRDELIKLFSYTSYNQVNAVRRDLIKGVDQNIDLPEGFELVLTLQGWENDRIQVRALVRKAGLTYVDTVLSILQPGVVFVGGPELEKGALIIVLETGF